MAMIGGQNLKINRFESWVESTTSSSTAFYFKHLLWSAGSKLPTTHSIASTHTAGGGYSVPTSGGARSLPQETTLPIMKPMSVPT